MLIHALIVKAFFWAGRAVASNLLCVEGGEGRLEFGFSGSCTDGLNMLKVCPPPDSFDF